MLVEEKPHYSPVFNTLSSVSSQQHHCIRSVQCSWIIFQRFYFDYYSHSHICLLHSHGTGSLFICVCFFHRRDSFRICCAAHATFISNWSNRFAFVGVGVSHALANRFELFFLLLRHSVLVIMFSLW